MQVGSVKSQHTDDKSPLKVAWSGSRDPFYILEIPMFQNGWSESRQILCTGRIYPVLALGDKLPPNGRSHVHVTRFIPCNTMLTRYMLSSGCPSQAGTVLKRLYVGSHK